MKWIDRCLFAKLNFFAGVGKNAEVNIYGREIFCEKDRAEMAAYMG